MGGYGTKAMAKRINASGKMEQLRDLIFKAQAEGQ
jgi:hypothetical protein